MLVFLVMGYLSPNFNKSAKDAEALLRRWTPVSVILLFVISALGARADWYLFALYCIAAWPLSITHPLVGQRSRPDEVGRAIAFFNLLLFVGVFLWQWSFGAVVTILAPTVGVESAYQMAMAALGVLSAVGYAVFVLSSRKSTRNELDKPAPNKSDQAISELATNYPGR